MELFDTETCKIFERLAQQDVATEMDAHFGRLKSWKVPSVHFGDPREMSEEHRARRNLDILCQGLLHRNTRLLRSICPLMKQRNIYGIALLARGYIESTAQLGYFCDRIVALGRRNITFSDFNNRLAETLLGAASAPLLEAPKPLNIMTCIEKSERHLGRQHQVTEKIISDTYGWLSEYCHPNFMSVSQSFNLDKETNTFHFDNDEIFSERDFHIILTLHMNISIFEMFYDDIKVIPPFLAGLFRRTQAAIFNFWAGVIPPIPMLGLSLL